MTRIVYLLAALGLLAGGAAVTTAQATDNNPGGGHTPVTVCHKPGTPAQQTLVVDDDAVPGHLGHGDTLGECEGPPPPCPEGTVLQDEECVPVTPPTDYCDTLEGVQAEDEDCPPPPNDVCPNLEGNQEQVPEGFMLANDECVLIPPPPPPPPHQVTGNAGVYCDTGTKLYRTVGTIDGQQADSVTPSSLPGNTNGVTPVTVKRGDTTFFATVTTNGDCDQTVPPVTPTAITPVVPVAPAAKPPAAKPKPPARKPAAKPKAKPKPKPTVHVCKPYKDGTQRVWVKGTGCHIVLSPEPSHLTG